MSSASLGAWGEARAHEDLIAQGFTLHASNWRCHDLCHAGHPVCDDHHGIGHQLEPIVRPKRERRP